MDILLEALPWLILVWTALWAGYMLGIDEGKKRQLRIQQKVVARLTEKMK